MSGATARTIDWRQLRALLRAYFIVSTRSMPVGVTGARRMRTLPFILGIYTLLGFAMSATAALLPSVFVFSLFIHLLTFFLVGTMALNEAAEVLFNARDSDVLGYRPISPSTLVFAKGLTILGFCGMMAAAVNLGPCVLGSLVKDARASFGPVHALSVLIETLFLCGVVVCAYGVIARFLGAERFQRLVTAAQIVSTVLLVIGFQVLPRIAATVTLERFGDLSSPMWLLPSMWFAALDAALASKTSMPIFTYMALAGVAITVLVLWIGVLRLPSGAPESRSAPAPEPQTSAAEKVPTSAHVADRGARGGLLALPIWSWWMRDPAERAVFRLCAIHLWRERALKVRLAAALSSFAVFPILMILQETGRSAFSTALVWLSALVPLNVLDVLRTSSTPDSAELFLFAPIRDPTVLLHGARKAALAFIVLPLVVYSFSIAAWASREEPQRLWLALPVLFLIPPISMFPGLRGDYVPLSQAIRAGERSAQVLAVLLGMVPLGLAFALVFTAREIGLLAPALVVVFVLAVALHFGLRSWIKKRARFALRR